MTKIEQIIKIHREQPELTHSEIASIVDCHRTYVTNTLRGGGFSVHKRITEIESRVTKLEDNI